MNMGYENGNQFYFGFSQWGMVTARQATTIQTHNAVSVGASGSSNGNNVYMDMSGFSDLALTVMLDAAVSHSAMIYWSHDGITLHGAEPILTVSVTNNRSASTPIKAKFAKVAFNNADAAAHTVSAWVYLKT